MTEEVISVKDGSTVISISYEEMLKYHGRSYVAGVAMAFKLLAFTLAELAGGEAAFRDRIRVVMGVDGPGLIDGIEMVTRAETRGRLIVSQHMARDKDAPDAADGHAGKYYFEVSYDGRKMCLALKHGLIPAEFIELSDKVHAGTLTAGEARRLQHLKEAIADSLIAVPAPSLFTVFGIHECAPASECEGPCPAALRA